MWPLEIEARRAKRSSPVGLVHALQDHLGGGSGGLAEGFVDFGEQRGVVRRVVAVEGVGRGLQRWSRMQPSRRERRREAGLCQESRHPLDMDTYLPLDETWF